MRDENTPEQPAVWEPRNLSDGRKLPLHIEFRDYIPSEGVIPVKTSSASPSEILEMVRAGQAILMHGDFSRIDAIWRYIAHRSADLAPKVKRGPGKPVRAKERAGLVRAALHRMLVEARGDELLNVTGAPELPGLRDWVDGARELGEEPFLLPFRRLQRIISDIRRQAEGIEIKALDARITVFPHVYLPSDQSVVDLFAENAADDLRDKDVLDMGTGSGVLALVAAKLGAKRVVAVDISPHAVANARRNAELLGMRETVEVRDQGDLFEPVADESFDLVVFNTPWMPGKPTTLYDTAIYDEDYGALRRFVAELPAHLRPGGKCLLILSNATQIVSGGLTELLVQLARDAGLGLRERACVVRQGRALGGRERVRLIELAAT